MTRPWEIQYVFAGTRRQAVYYATEKGWTPAQWRYINSPELLHGLRLSRSQVHWTGTPSDRADYLQLRQEVQAATARDPMPIKGVHPTLVIMDEIS
jgi:hypothetical protein